MCVSIEVLLFKLKGLGRRFCHLYSKGISRSIQRLIGIGWYKYTYFVLKGDSRGFLRTCTCNLKSVGIQLEGQNCLLV